MPLSEPAAREHIHSRTLEMQGFRRADGLWDIEGHLVDHKTYGFDNRWRGRVEAGMPVHEMRMRLTIDEKMLVRGVEAVTDAAPFPACAEITPAYRKLEGMRIGPGWNVQVRRMLGGVRGCTHLVEMLGPMATVAYQTLVGQRRKTADDATPEQPRRKPPIIDTCHALASDGAVVHEEWPEFRTGDQPAADGPAAGDQAPAGSSGEPARRR